MAEHLAYGTLLEEGYTMFVFLDKMLKEEHSHIVMQLLK